MKVIIVGATGTIGKHVVKAIEKNNEIIKLTQRAVTCR